ncbi:YkvA family protein [Mesobacillus zeae]|uniref:DUF1232 domain-containing protein n=1 Tax=Mesobacillus zeae TaxID=1917180 RepID=A0A398AUN5_9BACI|nr:YkvA family protein [Mesobacillus zeae]RID81439.1 DUF1232 domain-containing protein [Mesobacillus zeae]
MMVKIKAWAKRLKQKIFILYLACKDVRVPWHAKVLSAVIVAYAFSPIDLIPDFIPILGYLDDVIIVPLGIFLALKMIPREVLLQCEAKAHQMEFSKPKNWIAGLLILVIWGLLILWLVVTVRHHFL